MYNDTQYLNTVLQQQKQDFNNQPYHTYQQRKSLLKAVYNIIIENQEVICQAINNDFGNRPFFETKTLEIFASIEAIKFYLKNLKSLMRSKKHQTSKWFLPSKSYVLPQPKGVIGIITPWNYPLFLIIAPLAGAIAAGNRVMIKTSEYTPNFSKLIIELFKQKIAIEKIAIFTGDSAFADNFSKLDFDHLLFTGSYNIGQTVYSNAVKTLTPVTLELGGKSPVVLLEDSLKQKIYK